MNQNFLWFKLTLGVIATVGLYSVLYRESKFYRFFEHVFLGLAAGYALVVLWSENLKPGWWDVMTGSMVDGKMETPGYWAFAFILPIGFMGYFVFSKKHNWMSKIPIGVILGFWSGQQVQTWWNRWGPQIYASMQPVVPTSTDRFTKPFTGEMTPEVAAAVNSAIYPSEALSNFIFVVTVLASLSYFFFSFDIKGKFMQGTNTLGRWLLMIGFGAIFGSTVMARFVLEIDRMSYIFVEWLQQTMLTFGGG